MKKNCTLLLYLLPITILAQSDIDSPYSMFGIGKNNLNYFGASSGLGNSGIAYSNEYLLNKLNPASLASIKPTSFLYDIGMNNTLSLKADQNSSQKNYDFNFTNIAIGFSVSNFWKMSFGLVPKTKTSYNLDVIEPVDGNTNEFLTNIVGSGGVNEIFWGHGIKVSRNLSLGMELLAYFGSIKEEKYVYYDTWTIYLNENRSYKGVSLKGAFQYTIPDLFGSRTTLGGTINLPSTLVGSMDVEGEKYFSDTDNSTLVGEEDIEISDAEIPMRIGIGISSEVNNLTFNLDYQKSYWSDAYNSAGFLSYKDQEIFSTGFEYKLKTQKLTSPLLLRAGGNYDTGYLNLSDVQIDSYGFSAGIGIPISESASSLNISYSFGREGTLSNNLIVDNFHKLSLNLSLVNKWFQKRKIF